MINASAALIGVFAADRGTLRDGTSSRAGFAVNRLGVYSTAAWISIGKVQTPGPPGLRLAPLRVEQAVGRNNLTLPSCTLFERARRANSISAKSVITLLACVRVFNIGRSWRMDRQSSFTLGGWSYRLRHTPLHRCSYLSHGSKYLSHGRTSAIYRNQFEAISSHQSNTKPVTRFVHAACKSHRCGRHDTV